jgi:hypothetical protein
MSISNLGVKGQLASRQAHKADYFTAFRDQMVYKMWKPQRRATMWASTACYSDGLTFLYDRSSLKHIKIISFVTIYFIYSLIGFCIIFSVFLADEDNVTEAGFLNRPYLVKKKVPEFCIFTETEWQSCNEENGFNSNAQDCTWNPERYWGVLLRVRLFLCSIS